MYRTLIAFALVGLSSQFLFSQSPVKGRVVVDSSGVQTGITGIEIYIPATGERTLTDNEGYFMMTPLGTGRTDIVARFSVKDSNTFWYHPVERPFPLLVTDIKLLKDIEIRAKKAASQINSRGVHKVEILNEGEFKKAACCTLSESFETNNTVEVSNADGVSGIRQVEMLGLAGKYVLMTRDNMTTIRGLNVLSGLDQIPGPMVSGVHIAKGAGSVTNGFEGITGGLNYALKSEPNEPRLFLNGYLSSQRRFESNLILSQRINKNTFNHAYLHYQNRYHTQDQGGDGFADIPIGMMVYLGDMLKYYGKKTEGQFGISYSGGERNGGDIREFHKGITHPVVRFHFNIKEERTEAFAKLGIFLNENGSSSIGNILLFSQTKSSAQLNNLIGRTYEGTQNTLSYTGLYTTPDDDLWSIKAGVNAVYDDVDERYEDSFGMLFSPERKEFSAGVFSELVYKGEKLNWVLGGRFDRNNLYGNILTPRFHLKYDVTKNQQFHFQAGLGRRTPWIFADNLPYFISNRKLSMPHYLGSTQPQWAYRLPQEKGFNAGVSYTWHLMAFKLPSTISADGFYTYFIDQTVVDRDQDPGLLIIENQKNNASSMFQLDWNLKPHRRIDVKLSYRFVNTQMVLGGVNRLQTMQAPHRGLLVFGYTTRKQWAFDWVTQYNSPKRLPSTVKLSESNQRGNFSPDYTLVNLQIRKELKKWEFYAGCENVLNVIQKDPVLSVTDQGKEVFDAAFAWGPTMGRNFYLGFRLKLK